MFAIIVIGLLGWAAYQFYKYSAASSAEVTRAYLFLNALLRGEDDEKARSIASVDVQNLEAGLLQRISDEIHAVHEGRQLPLVAEAYRRGMPSRMPTWYQRSVSLCDRTDSVFAVYGAPLALKEKQPRWVRSFVIYFVLDRLKAQPQGSVPGSTLIPEDFIELLEGTVSDSLALSITASLKPYMDFAFPDTTGYQSGYLAAEIRSYLADAMHRIMEPGVIRQAVQKSYHKLAGADMVESELDDFMRILETRQAEGSEVIRLVHGLAMTALTEDEFQSRHGMSFELFEKRRHGTSQTGPSTQIPA